MAARPPARAEPPHAAGRTMSYRREGGSGRAAGRSRATAVDLPPTTRPTPRPRPAATARQAGSNPQSVVTCLSSLLPDAYAPGEHERGQRSTKNSGCVRVSPRHAHCEVEETMMTPSPEQVAPHLAQFLDMLDSA